MQLCMHARGGVFACGAACDAAAHHPGMREFSAPSPLALAHMYGPQDLCLRMEFICRQLAPLQNSQRQLTQVRAWVDG